MSEKTAVGYARELVASLWHSFPEDAEQPIAAAIAAAEERGRRRGVEEAAKECELRIASWERLRDQPTVAARVDEAESLAEIIRCLAPRDSAPVCDAVLSSDPFREWRCGKPKGHEGPHSGHAPLDAGKEGP